MFTRKKPRVRQQTRLAVELLEHRLLLTASPMSDSLGGRDFDHGGHRQDHHQSPPAEQRIGESQPRAKHGDHHRDGNARHEPPRRGGGNRQGPPRQPSASEVPPTPLLPGGPPVAAPTTPPPLVVTVGITIPSATSTPPAPFSPLPGSPSPTSQPAALLDGRLSTDLLADGESALLEDTLRSPGDSATTLPNPTNAGARLNELQPAPDAARSNLFAAMADGGLLEEQLAFLDDLVEARRAARVAKLGASAEPDAEFSWFAANDKLRAKLDPVKRIKPFRDGFVDIGDTGVADDELLRGYAAKRPPEDGVPRHFPADRLADFASRDVAREHVPSGDSSRLYQSHPTAGHAAHDAELPTEGQFEEWSARSGMIELAHDGKAFPDGVIEPADEPGMHHDGQPSFLKMEGAIVRYQAFETTPLQATSDVSPLPAAESDVDKEPPSERLSGPVPGRSSSLIARASLAPAILAFLWRRRSRRSDLRSP